MTPTLVRVLEGLSKLKTLSTHEFSYDCPNGMRPKPIFNLKLNFQVDTMESSSTSNSSSQLKTTNSSSQVKTTPDSSYNSCAPEKSPARKKLKEDIIKTDDNSDTKPDPKSTAKPEPEQTESKTPKVRAINNFFNKMSKEEYRKELKRSTVSAVLTVRALVHSPEPPLEPVASAPAPKKTAPVPSKKQRFKFL